MSEQRRVLFVCTANSARSLMAEAMLKSMAGEQFEVASAGTAPESPHPLAIQCLQKAGIATDDIYSKPVSAVSNERWDYVITLCEKASRECQPMTSIGQMIAWDFPDPVPANRPATFALLLKELKERISLFIMVHQKAASRPIHYPPAGVLKALGDENRLAIMHLVTRQQELCVCELTAMMEMAQPRMSRYLSQLREQALLEDERRGQWVYYRLHPALPDWLLTLLHDTTRVSRDDLKPMLERLAAMPDRPAQKDCV